MEEESQKKLEDELKKRKELADKIQKDLEKVSKKAKPFKDEILKKYAKELIGITVIPPQENGKDPEILVLLEEIDEEDFEKKIKKSQELGEKIEKIGSQKIPKVKVNSTFIDQLWDACYKGRYEILKLITLSLPIHDTGWIGALKAAEIHKVQLLQKFENYIVCYVLAGSMVRGEATPDSDIDTYVVIDDTDVSRMTRREIKDKLRAIILGKAREACIQAGINNKLNVQVYILTDMWDSIKEAHPVIFTFLRDGIPLYDRGMFMPWKLLLKMGRITPTPEAIDKYMNMGTSILDNVKNKMKEIASEDPFWSTIYPSQGALMLKGLPPPDPKQTPKLLREEFVKSKLLEEKWVKVLEKNIQLRKDIEYGKIEDVDPNVVLKRIDESREYLKRLEKLFETLEKTQVKEEAKALYRDAKEDVLAALSMMDEQAGKDIIASFKKVFVDRSLAGTRYLEILKKIQELSKTYKTSRKELSSLRCEEARLSEDLFERIRIEKGKKLDKYRISCNYGDKKTAAIWLLTKHAYIIKDVSKADTSIWKFTIDKKGELRNKKKATLKEIENALNKFAGTPTKLTKHTIKSLKDILGKDMKLVVG
ncbi:MAG: nucleotidyltransferase domain-containing protein [Candidatus Woesearchaeota archaeon]|nr:MAG: nucleotidyltransferase domain-containing protein [Candidatus Woesearchaeota archaeon]